VVWLCIFITEGATQVILFRKSNPNRHMIIVGLFDCAISITCLGFFIRAEVERCCNCDKTTSYRLLAETDNGPSCDKYHDCCPRFGDRLCGGAGVLEPATAIIVFRLLRFAFAKRAFLLFEKKDSLKSDKSSDDDKEKASEDPQSAVQIVVEATHITHEMDFEHTPGTIAQLWTAAVLKHPDIVQEYGLFSGLLLEAMLGIEGAPSAKSAHAISSPKKISFQLEQGSPTDQTTCAPSFKRKSLHDRQMSRASSEGSIGRNNNEDNEHNFIRPAAALIRSMRRCQCKWLPLLDDWEVVDVILTKYEIVWLDPKPVSRFWDENIDSKRDAIKKMIRSQNGGKGMSLCDVVVGREVLGRLPLSDISQIKVQRFPPGERHPSKRKGRKRDVENVHENADFASEFWADSKVSRQQYGENSDRWTSIMEDDLVLHSPQGSLCLRFLVDLLDEETKDEKATNVQSFGTKEGALLWCQTVSHLCGPHQLKQQLMHFGEQRDLELLDFVEAVEPNKFNRSWRRSRAHIYNEK